MSQRLRLIVSAVCLLAVLLALQLRSQGEAVPLRRSLGTLPYDIGGWQGKESTLFDTDVLAILKPTDYLVRRYAGPSGQNLWLYIGYWQTQRKGVQVHSPKNCLPGAGWEPVEASRIAISVGGGHDLTLNRYVVQKGKDRQVVLYWYRAQGADVASEVGAKVAMVKHALAHNRSDGALIRISSNVTTTPAETTERLTAYVRALYPVLSDYLP